MVPNAVFSVASVPFLLHVSMADINEGWRSFHFFSHECLFQRLFLSTATFHVESPPRINAQVRACLVDRSEEVL